MRGRLERPPAVEKLVEIRPPRDLCRPVEADVGLLSASLAKPRVTYRSGRVSPQPSRYSQEENS